MFRLQNVPPVKRGFLVTIPRDVNYIVAVRYSNKYNKTLHLISRRHLTLHQKSALPLRVFPSVPMSDHRTLKTINSVCSVFLSIPRPHRFVERTIYLQTFLGYLTQHFANDFFSAGIWSRKAYSSREDAFV